MKKILIIGASGYIGNRCFKEFNYDSEYEVFGTQFTSTRNDLITLDYSKPKDFFKSSILLELVSKLKVIFGRIPNTEKTL